MNEIILFALYAVLNLFLRYIKYFLSCDVRFFSLELVYAKFSIHFFYF